MKAEVIQQNKNYRKLAYASGILLLIVQFIQFENNTLQSYCSLINDLIAITTFTFTFLWLKRQIILIGLILYGLSWNIDLLTNPITANKSEVLIHINLTSIGLVFNAIVVLFLLLGLFDSLKPKFLIKGINIDSISVIRYLILFTFLIQFTIRIFV